MDLQPYFDASRNPVTKLDLSLSPLTTLSIPLNFTCQCVPQDPAELALEAGGTAMVKFSMGTGIPSPRKPPPLWESPVYPIHVDLRLWTARPFHVEPHQVANKPSLWIATSVRSLATAGPFRLSAVPRPPWVTTPVQVPTNVRPFCLDVAGCPLQSG